MSKRILILTASPHRDSIVDEMLAEELRKKGHDVRVEPCLRNGRQAIMEYQPGIVVMPPIRNPHSRDMVEDLKRFGCAVVSRHTEPSCDQADFDAMEPWQQMEIFGKYPYHVDAEIVWSEQEAEILNKRSVKFKAHAAGAFTVDAYLRQDIIDAHRNKAKFCQDHKLDPEKKTLLICSPWGFADTAPDLHVDDVDVAKKDIEGRDRHLAMIRVLKERLGMAWNIVVTIHPGVVQQPYKDLCEEMEICLDTESTSFDLKCNVDGIVHAGSTMAIGAHFLGIPAWQFGDVYCKDGNNWWMKPETAISKISPHFTDPVMLAENIKSLALVESIFGSNANPEALAELEKGRFGLFDGQATKRAADIVDTVDGEFKFIWPRSVRDYSQLTIIREPRRLYTPMTCSICGEEFCIVNESWLNMATQNMLNYLAPLLKEPPDTKLLSKMWQPPHSHSCPHCAARWVVHEE